MPLSPLDPDALADRIASLDVVQETDTPIVAALREVPGDLADSTGTHVLVESARRGDLWRRSAGGYPLGPLRRGRRRAEQGGLAGSAGTRAAAGLCWTALQSMLTLRRRPGPKWRNGRRCGLKHR